MATNKGKPRDVQGILDEAGLVHFHLYPLLLLKPELFSLPVHIAPFSDRNGYLSTSVALVFKKAPNCLFEKQDWQCFSIQIRIQIRIQIPPFLVFRIQICVFIQLRFCQRIHLAPFLGWINVSPKPKTELKISVFLLKRIHVNGA